jgi:hypothetical protein
MFYYKIDYLDEIDGKARQESGILSATDYTQAASRVAEFYGIANIISMYLEKWEDVLTEDEVLEGFEKADLKE